MTRSILEIMDELKIYKMRRHMVERQLYTNDIKYYIYNDDILIHFNELSDKLQKRILKKLEIENENGYFTGRIFFKYKKTVFGYIDGWFIERKPKNWQSGDKYIYEHDSVYKCAMSTILETWTPPFGTY